MSPDPNNRSTKLNPVGHFMVAAGSVIEMGISGKILLVQRAVNLDWHPGEWEICYGRIDQFEDVEKGLRREVREELGITEITIIKVLRVWHMFRGTKKAENELIGITYYCRTNNKIIKLSHEHSQYKWTLPEDALKLVANEGIKQDINKFITSSTIPIVNTCQ